jgi:hypothetical protein
MLLLRVLIGISSAFALLFKDQILKFQDVILGSKFTRDIAKKVSSFT